MCNTESSVPIFSNASSIILIFFPYICQLTLKSTHLPGRYMFCKQCTLLNLSAFITTILPILSVYQLAEWQQKSIFHAYQITRPPLHTCKTKDGHLFLLSMGNSFVFFFFLNRKFHFCSFQKTNIIYLLSYCDYKQESDFSYHYWLRKRLYRK